MTEPIWMELRDALIAHDLELAAHGGSSGVRDVGLLESALARPRNLLAYADEAPSLTRLAASYAFGISSNQPFVDGNKRTALLISFASLDVNGIAVTASQVEAYNIIIGLAAGEVDEQQLAEWFEANSGPLER